MIASKQLRLSRHTGELAAAVPQVVAHRVGRMMAAGPLPGARDQQEFYRMGAEKVAGSGKTLPMTLLSASAEAPDLPSGFSTTTRDFAVTRPW